MRQESRNESKKSKIKTTLTHYIDTDSHIGHPVDLNFSVFFYSFDSHTQMMGG